MMNGDESKHNPLLLIMYSDAGGDDVYDDFAATYGRRHLSVQHYEHRKAVFYENKAFVDGWNAQANAVDSHTLKLNHFADWDEVSLQSYPP